MSGCTVLIPWLATISLAASLVAQAPGATSARGLRTDFVPPRFGDREHTNAMVRAYLDLHVHHKESIEEVRARAKVAYYMSWARVEIFRATLEGQIADHERRQAECASEGRIAPARELAGQIRECRERIARLDRALAGSAPYEVGECKLLDHVYDWADDRWQRRELPIVDPPRAGLQAGDFSGFALEAPDPADADRNVFQSRYEPVLAGLQRRAPMSAAWSDLAREVTRVRELVDAAPPDWAAFAAHWQATWSWILRWGEEEQPSAFPTLDAITVGSRPERVRTTEVTALDRRPPRFDDRDYVNALVDQYVELRRREPQSIQEARARTKVNYYMRFARLEKEVLAVQRRHLAATRRLEELEAAGQVHAIDAQEQKTEQIAIELETLDLALRGQIRHLLPRESDYEHVYHWRAAEGWVLERLAPPTVPRTYVDFVSFGGHPPTKNGFFDGSFLQGIAALQRRAHESQEWLALSAELGRVVALMKPPSREIDAFVAYWRAVWSWVMAWGDEGVPSPPPTLETMESYLVSNAAGREQVGRPVARLVQPPPRRPIEIPESVDIGEFLRTLRKTNQRKPGPSRLEHERRTLQRRFCLVFQVDRVDLFFDKVVANMAGPFRVFWADLRAGTDADLALRLTSDVIKKLDLWSHDPNATPQARREAEAVLEDLRSLESLVRAGRWDDAEAVLRRGRDWILRGSPFPQH